MRGRSALAALSLAIGLLLSAAGAFAAPGGNASPGPGPAPDPGFGTGGLVELPAELPVFASAVATSGGTLLASSGLGVQVMNEAGAPGEAFGGVGSLPVPTAPGDEFLISDLTIDSEGRLLVVGETRFPEAENPSPTTGSGIRVFRPAIVRMLRFLSDGRLDPSFGQGGVVETGLGLPAPLGTDGKRLGLNPAVAPGTVAIDREGRIVLTGDAVVRLDRTCGGRDRTGPAAISAGFVARFTESGTLDSSFGTAGLVGGRSLGKTPLGAAGLGDPVTGANGSVTVRSTAAYTCGTSSSHLGLTRLTQAGKTDRSFGRKGVMLGRYDALAGGQEGSVVALAAVSRRRPEKEDLTAHLIRVTAGGKQDRSFGEDGRATITLGPGYGTNLDSLAVDSRGRVLVAGTIGIHTTHALALARVSSGGDWEKGFGPHGRVATPVPRPAEYGGSDLFFDSQGRLLTDRLYSGSVPGTSGLVVARYLLH